MKTKKKFSKRETLFCLGDNDFSNLTQILHEILSITIFDKKYFNFYLILYFKDITKL